MTINIDNGLAFTGVHILSTLQSTNNRPQPRLYVDDVVLVSTIIIIITTYLFIIYYYDIYYYF